MHQTWLWIVLILSQISLSHPLDLGVLQIRLSGKELFCNLDLAEETVHLLKIQPTDAKALFETTIGKSSPILKDGSCQWQNPEAALSNQTVKISVKANCQEEGGELKWDILFLRDPLLPKDFRLITKMEVGGQETLQTLQKEKVSLLVSLSQVNSFGDFIWLGIGHIGALPSEWIGEEGFHLPEGLDHILFLLALILAGGGFLGLVKTATGFTVGHSVTLALASLGILRIPPSIIEPIIALSISYVAIEDLFKKSPKGRWKVASAFGFIHGFAFAGALTELNLEGKSLFKALIGFNLGVELGQIAVMLILVPFLLLLQSSAKVYEPFRTVTACAVALLGLYWFIERAFL